MTTLWKPCIVCGDLGPRDYCDDCRPARKPAAKTAARGYGSSWQALSRRARRMQPFCTDCGTTSDLTVDHSPEAWKRHEQGLPITLDLVAVVCRSCNSKRGAARPGRVDPPRPLHDRWVSRRDGHTPPGGIQ